MNNSLVNIENINVNININLFDVFDEIKSRYRVAKSKIENVRIPPIVLSNWSIEYRPAFQSFHIFNSILFDGKFGENPDVYLIFSKYGSEIILDNLLHEIQPDRITVKKLKKLSIYGSTYNYQIDEQNCYFSVKEDEFQVKPFILVVDGGNCLGFTVLYYINKAMNTSPNSMNVPYFGKNPFYPQLLDARSWPGDKELRKKVRYGDKGFVLDKIEIRSIKKIKKYFLESLDASYREKMKEKYADDE